jgi:hypothetical protein
MAAAGSGIDRGWPTILGIHSQAVSGSTAAQWASDANGWLTTAKNTPSEVLILSLLGNDAFAIAQSGFNFAAAAAASTEFAFVLSALRRAENYVLLYPDPYSGKNQEFNEGWPILNSAIAGLSVGVIPDVTLVHLGDILAPSDFNGVNMHPILSGHQKIADYFKPLLA